MMLTLLEGVLVFLLLVAVLSQQPISLGVFLLVYCFFLSGYLFSFFSSWFSLSLFLIYIGGMLVLFGYVLVLIPNFVFSVLGLVLIPFFFFFFFFFFSSGGEVSAFVYSFSFSLFSLSNLVVYLSLSLVLFIGLVSVAKICFFQVGALRPFYLF